MDAFDLHDDYRRHRAKGGREHFPAWCARYGDDYGCDAEWLAEDYLRVVRRHEDDQEAGTVRWTAQPPSFRAWLALESPEYRAAHLDAGGAEVA